MNNYPSWWNTTVTLYNKYVDSQTQIITWHPTVLTNCFWKDTGNTVVINNVTLKTDDVICRIPVNEKYLEKGDWDKLPNDQMNEFFTLFPGDIIIKGEVDDVINEYVSGKRATDVLKKYKAVRGCLEIKTAANNTGGGRGNEHYYVVGI